MDTILLSIGQTRFMRITLKRQLRRGILQKYDSPLPPYRACGVKISLCTNPTSEI